ncbi:MT-A70 family methyltransferase [Serratia marcescens]|uniref:MT-A70 family methyltransferase n=1 Tax=Serratia marcescens TaxID=615 RepID=UPI000744FA3A|nr:MT-A70 family methyltransferase [Serratia marcescens]MBN3902801.1 DNA methyltransferase [Serratia marcescens]MBN3912151.1 DNA methyltransferase [Serratia marcescens]MBN3916951.1 DNA methyltransferase [Serratia marcescens]MBN3935428.1 DNA methyltransferase [Serratia marcescens]MBN3952658.1 DNA methyltransferase [Serratia marcescens]
MTYQLIYADPPWDYKNRVSNGAATKKYPTMKIEDIKRLPIWSIAAPDSILAMWYTSTHVDEACRLAEAWGFSVRTMKAFTWVKLNQQAELRFNKALEQQTIFDFSDLLEMLNAETRMNGGNYTRANSEDVLIAVRGQGIERASASIKQVVFSCLGEHSAKPWEVRRRLELLYGDVSRIELFSRGDAPGWDHWGNQCPVNSLQLLPAAFSKTLSDQ